MATKGNIAPYAATTETSTVETVPASSSGDGHRQLAARVLGGVGAALAFCAIILIITTLLIRWRRGQSRKGIAENRPSGKKRALFCSNIGICNSGQLLSDTLSQTPKKHIHFSIDDLVAATNAFDEATVVGEGGFGKVYRGVLVTPPFSKVAIKVLTGSSSQGVREFITEIEVLSKLDHKHLVRLLGSCMVDEQLLLVYRHVANGSLSDHLHGDNRQSRTNFPWAKRVKIALGAALGVQHLHEQNPSVLHRDIKAANILLTRGFNAKVCDFGFAKQLSSMPDGSSARFCWTPGRSGAIGTLGYVAPESMMTGEVSSASDVYSFGVVLLELLTGRKPLDFTKPEKDQSLVKWARILLDQERISELIDPPLLEELPRIRDSALLFLRISRLCLEMDSRVRPSMADIVQTLRMIKADYDSRPESICINLSDSDTASEISAERTMSEISLRSDDRKAVDGSCCLDQFWKQRFQGGNGDCEEGLEGGISKSVRRRSTSEPINISRPLSWLLLGLSSSTPPTPPRGY